MGELTVKERGTDFWLTGVVSSVVGHLLLAVFMVTGLFSNGEELTNPIIYSVSIEGGKNLGGIDQTPKDDKSQLAPPKKVRAEEKIQPKPEEQKPEPKKVEEEPEPEEDAEVSVAEKKPTPQPAQPTARPQPTPKAKATPAPKPTAKVDPKKAGKQQSQGDKLDKQYQAALQRYLGESTNAGGQGFGAASLGGKGMGGGRVVPAEVKAYIDLVNSRIKDAWRWFDPNSTLINQVAFEIEPDGRSLNVRVIKSSGSKGFDDSAVRAVLKAGPFPPPPPKSYETFFKGQDFRVTFDPRDLR